MTFHPLTYAMLHQLTWRWTYVTLALLVLVVGLLMAAMFKPCDNVYQSNESSTDAPYTELDQQDLVIPLQTKLVMKSLWFFASGLKSMAFYIPFITLVRKLYTFTYRCLMNSYKYNNKRVADYRHNRGMVLCYR